MNSEEIQFTEPAFPPIIEESLDPAWDFGVSAQHIVLSHFRKMLSWRASVQRNEEVEGVHQIRVEARRTRTALQTFAALWPSTEVRGFSKYLADFATAFGDARDLDVMIIYLSEELKTAEGERAAAYNWLLERNRSRRLDLQPNLDRQLLQLEQSGFPAAFAAYFATKPFDLWELAAPAQSAEEAEPVELQNG